MKSAEEEAPSADLSVSLSSKYVWRGYELSKDSVVIQPSLTVGYKGFAANFWGNLDTDQKGASDSFLPFVIALSVVDMHISLATGTCPPH